jgi:hypothetical protein
MSGEQESWNKGCKVNTKNWRKNFKIGGKAETFIGLKKDKDGFPVGYMEDGGKVYRIKVTDGKKTDRNGNQIEHWVTIQETDFEPYNRR